MTKWLKIESWLYRKRYIIGYLLVAVGFAALLYTAATVIPGGISSAEERSFVKAAELDLQDADSLATVSLPYYAAQRYIVETLGVSLVSIKLLSIILAFVTGIGAVFLLRRWFRPNIALLATIIMITTGQFLYIAQSGSPSITYILWPIWLLLTATLITTSPRHARFWKVLFFILVPLSLYTPLSIYLVLAIISAGLIHPHVRHVVRRMSMPHLALLSAMSLVLIAPLIYLIIKDPSIGLYLLGAPTTWPPDILSSARELTQQYFNFIEPQSGRLMTPVLGLGSIILIILGVWRLVKIRYTARSYTLVAWVILLIPILLINPVYTTAAFVPLLILLAMGLEFLLRSWYRMFPRNPYARFVGLVPLIILVSGLVISGLGRYFDGYRYDPVTASSFHKDLDLLERDVRSDSGPMTLVVSKGQYNFYNAIALIDNRHSGDNKLIITAAAPASPSGRLAATKAAKSKVTLPIDRIVTTSTSTDADRFYIYRTK